MTDCTNLISGVAAIKILFQPPQQVFLVRLSIYIQEAICRRTTGKIYHMLSSVLQPTILCKMQYAQDSLRWIFYNMLTVCLLLFGPLHQGGVHILRLRVSSRLLQLYVINNTFPEFLPFQFHRFLTLIYCTVHFYSPVTIYSLQICRL